MLFELHRRLVIEGAMEADWVVKVFDVVADGDAGLGQIAEGAGVDEFGFEGAPEGFHGGIVIAVAAGTHTGGKLMGVQQSPEGAAGILGTLIGMMEEAGRWLAT